MEPGDYYREPQVKVNEEEAKKTAWDLIEKLQPGKAGEVVFRQSEPEIGHWVKMGGIVPQAYVFTYARIANGIVYPENGFRVRVDSTTGEVTSYEVIWWETTFPPASGVIGAASANRIFLAGHPLVLEYCRGHKRWSEGREPPEYYLIYRPAGQPAPIIDAVSGQEIDYQGNPVAKKDKQGFTDISGHPAEQDIIMLAGEGIIVGDEGKFRPDDPVTMAEMLSMLVKAYGRGPVYPVAEGGSDPWYKSVIDSALSMGILDESFTVSPEAGLNRLQLARLGVNAGGWGKLARLSRIFKLDIADKGSIPEEFRGYAATSLAMGLIIPEGGRFCPDGGVTRGEAASFLVRLLNQ
jgi:hypothetical protein